MQRHEWKFLLNWSLLSAALVAFSTGLMLLFCFHAGEGAFATSAFGVDRLVWLNVHRLSAVLAIAGMITHIWFHWRAFRNKLTNLVTRRIKKLFVSELFMYAVFFIATLTGLVAWLLVEGSSPLFGPALIGRASSTRHPWIDTHHVSSLVLLVLIVHHIGHHWGSMIRR